MSIINDALKRTDEFRTETQRFVLKRWLIWTGTGVICLLGFFLATNSLKGPADTINAAEELKPVPITEDVTITLDLPTFQLTGILYDPEEPLAIINEQIVTTGAFVEGAKLLEIQPNYVKLSFEGAEFQLKIK
ncbi:MAG: hypothetical protein JSV30_02105 [Candidatus Omnitrophota bacterium]|nr:MAG: hypothetical protein JSV30_02105 [Candidatus Omnitrophota bacterium]